MIPQTFEEWRDCIVRDCKIKLTKEFAAKRLSIYQNRNHVETRKFVQLYGKEHLKNVINWYSRIA